MHLPASCECRSREWRITSGVSRAFHPPNCDLPSELPVVVTDIPWS